MEEVFVEQIIKRRTKPVDLLWRGLAIFAVVLGLLSMLVIGALGFTVAALLVYVAYLIFQYTSLEYEYSLTNGELRIDKILGQRKRKKADEFDLKHAELIAPTHSEEVVRSAGNRKVMDYSSGYKSENQYSILMNHNQYGDVQIIIEPSEKVIDAMYHVRPNVVKKR